jgi:hypothetical protein
MSSTFIKPLYDVAVAQPQRPIYLENGNGVLLTWMDIGMPPWKAGRYLSLFDFPMERGLHPARLSLARTQSARTASLSRRAGVTCFIGPSRKQTTTGKQLNRLSRLWSHLTENPNFLHRGFYFSACQLLAWLFAS